MRLRMTNAAQDDIEPVTLSEAKGRILVEILRLRLRMTKAAQDDQSGSV